MELLVSPSPARQTRWTTCAPLNSPPVLSSSCGIRDPRLTRGASGGRKWESGLLRLARLLSCIITNPPAPSRDPVSRPG